MTDADRARLLVIVGPTGAGKTTLALALAERAAAEIVSADSQQVYVGMDIGTGKATAEDRARVRHHLIDVIRPDERMTAARFVALADVAIADIVSREMRVVVAGGTGLYVRALLLGIFDGPSADQAFRDQLLAESEAAGGPLVLWERLRAVDPESAERIDENDLIRITRALEVRHLTGETMTEHQRRHDHRRVPLRYPARIVCLSPPREALYERIEARVEAMLAAGLVAEVEALREAGYGAELRSQAAIGYAEIHQYVSGEIPLAEAVRLIKRNSRRYARRQLSWYRSDPRVEWVESTDAVDLPDLERYLRGYTGP